MCFFWRISQKLDIVALYIHHNQRWRNSKHQFYQFFRKIACIMPGKLQSINVMLMLFWQSKNHATSMPLAKHPTNPALKITQPRLFFLLKKECLPNLLSVLQMHIVLVRANDDQLISWSSSKSASADLCLPPIVRYSSLVFRPFFYTALMC
jgi:hypothetical protein